MLGNSHSSVERSIQDSVVEPPTALQMMPMGTSDRLSQSTRPKLKATAEKARTASGEAVFQPWKSMWRSSFV